MKSFPFGLNIRVAIAMLGALSLVSCSGGGGESGTTTPASSSPTPATTQAAVSELVDAFASTLTAAQVVPQRSSAATAAGTVVIQPATRLMTATLTTTGIAGTAADIQQAPAGLNGPIVFPLTETSRGSGIWTARAVLTEAQHNAFRAGDFYFNVRSTNFGEGEIRGQILSQQPGTTPATSTTTGTSTNTGTNTGTTSVGAGLNPFVTSTGTFLTALRGSQEVPPNTSVALGSGTVLVNPANGQLIAGVTTSGIAGTSAHIHEAPQGVNGPIIFPLAESVAGSGVWTTGAVLTEAQLASLRAGNFYFNVHSAAFPNGEIRGQILPQTISLEFVTGAAGRPGATNGTGTGLTGTGLTGTGLTGTGMTGTGLTGTGTTGTGMTGTGLTGTGTTGSGLTGTGLTGTGVTGTGTGLTGTGTGITGTGTGLTGTGLTGTGTTGTGATGAGLPGTGTTGIDTSVGLRF